MRLPAQEQPGFHRPGADATLQTMADEAVESGDVLDALPSGPVATEPVATERTPTAPLKLSRTELKRRLKRNSPELVKELYDIAKAQVQFEVGRQSRLDSKATSLLTASGLSITLTFVFGGVLINLSKTGEVGWWIVLAYIAAVACGLIAAACAVRALRVSDTYATFNEDTVFNEAVLDQADGNTEDESQRAGGVRDYQRFLIVQLWEIYQQHADNHELKATWIRRGQTWLFAFLAALFLICALVGFGLISGYGLREAAATAGSAGPPSTQANPGNVRSAGAEHARAPLGSTDPQGRDGGGTAAGTSGDPSGDATAAPTAAPAAPGSAAPAAAASGEEAGQVIGQ